MDPAIVLKSPGIPVRQVRDGLNRLFMRRLFSSTLHPCLPRRLNSYSFYFWFSGVLALGFACGIPGYTRNPGRYSVYGMR